jgi:hypothetical protein
MAVTLLCIGYLLGFAMTAIVMEVRSEVRHRKFQKENRRVLGRGMNDILLQQAYDIVNGR